MQNMVFKRLADLDTLVLEGSQHTGCVVLLHGYGADFTDLSSLASVVDPEQNWDWYFPNGSLEIPLSPFDHGRAWFPIDVNRLQAQLQTGQQRAFATHEPQGLKQASEQVQAMLKELQERYTSMCLGGFSQGAMVSCDAALHAAKKPDLLLQLSGTYTAENRWLAAIRQLERGFPVFQSHGRHDPILPFAGAEELQSFWHNHHFPSRFLPFQGGHEIPYDVLQALRLQLLEMRPSR